MIIRIAMVVNRFPTVSETFIFNKVMGLRQAGHDVFVHVQGEKNDAAFFEARLAGQPLDFVRSALTTFPPHQLLMRLTAILARQPNEARRLQSQAQKRYGLGARAQKAWLMALPLVLGNYDLIHFELSGLAVVYLDVLPLLRPAKLLMSCRGTAEKITPLAQPERAEKLRRVFQHLDLVHCVSANMQRTVEQYGLRPDQAFVNYPSIDVEEFKRAQPYLSKEQGPYQLLTVGRLRWEKGLEYGLLAVRHLVNEGMDLRYTIIGSGDEEERLRFAIHDLGLTEQVELMGRQPAAVVRQALESADVFLLPSLSEGLSNAVLEAMAMEIPVVSTTAGGMAEAIDHGMEGFLVPPREPEKMAENVSVLLSDPSLRRNMGCAGRRKVETVFNLQRQVECFVKEYRALVSRSERAHNPVGE